MWTGGAGAQLQSWWLPADPDEADPATGGRGPGARTHGDRGAGCVAVGPEQMAWLLRWLRFVATPVVSIGVGAAPYGAIPDRYV